MLKSFELKREIDCTARCFVEHNCMSFNTGLLDGSGTYVCELSDSDHEMHSEALKPKYGFTYHATEVSSMCNFNSKVDTKEFFFLCSEPLHKKK